MLNWLDDVQAWKSLALMMCYKFSFKGVFYHNISGDSLLQAAWLQEEAEAILMKLEQDLASVGAPLHPEESKSVVAPACHDMVCSGKYNTHQRHASTWALSSQMKSKLTSSAPA